ncbi:MAG: serine/threonine-protein kinase [Gemmataceae bacterium]
MTERDIFIAALQKEDAAERQAYLAEACAGQPDLRRHVDNLLRLHEGAGSFLERPAADAAPTGAFPDAAATAPSLETPGVLIGPYKLLEQIGEGGMGTVWMAQQTEPVKRLVALKLIKAGMDSKQVIARFEAERQALALMDHANIARVLDGGTTSAGRPYFVMDLVKGVPITKYCDEHHLTPRQRLELFLPVCQAIQHAHQKGIIHRDLKPSNVLVALYDGKPVPKVIDFGVAKAAGQPLTDKTLVTGFGAIVGTLEYMSPEQAEINQLDIDTRSDIYSLGVLLYELLTGCPPFSRKDLEKAGMLEMLRVIREQEPSRPSTKLSTAEGLPTLAANRGTEPAKLTKLVRGELDWIVMKALEKDRSRRYETANGFAMDVQRYLADEAVQACPPSVGYRLRKFARRNKGALLTVTLVALALAAATAVSTWQAVRATKAEGLAETRLETETDARQQAQHNLKEALRAVDQMLTRVGEEKLADVPHMEPVRKALLEDALVFYEDFLNKNGNDPALRLETAKAHRRLGNLYELFRASAKAEQAYQSAAAIFQELAKSEASSNSIYQHEWAVTTIGLGEVLAKADRIKEAVLLLREAVRIEKGLLAEEPDSATYRETLGNGYSVLGRVLWGSDEGVQALREAEAIHRQLVAEFPKVTRYRYHLAQCYERLGNVLRDRSPKEAEASLRQAIDLLEELLVEFPGVYAYRERLGAARKMLGIILTGAGRVPEAEKVLQDAHSLLTKLAHDFPHARGYEGDFCEICIQLGKLTRTRCEFGAARTYFEQAIYHGKRRLEASPDYFWGRVFLAASFNNLASTMSDLKDDPGAEKVYREAIDYFEKFPPKWAQQGILLRCRIRLWQLLERSGRPGAKQAHRDAERGFRKFLREGPAGELNNLAWLLAAAADPRVRHPGWAVELAQKAVDSVPKAGAIWNTLGVAQYRAGDWKAAIAALEKSMELRKGGDSLDWFFLAMAHWKRGEKDKAGEWYDRAVQWMDKNQPTNDELRHFRAEAAELLELKEKK